MKKYIIMIGIILSSEYELTKDDMLYIDRYGIRYDPLHRIIYINRVVTTTVYLNDIIIKQLMLKPYQLEHYRNCIRRIPNVTFYNSLIDNFGLHWYIYN